MNPWLDSLIQEAREGDSAAARALADYIAECLEKGETPPALAAYFAAAFKKIACGHKAGDALNVEGADKFDRDYEIAREVWKLSHRAVDRLPLKSEHKRGAYAVVADEYHLSPGGVERIYKDLHWLVEAEALELEHDLPRPEKPEWKRLEQRREAAMKLAFARLAQAFEKRNPSG